MHDSALKMLYAYFFFKIIVVLLLLGSLVRIDFHDDFVHFR